MPHLRRYQGFAVMNYSFTPGALYLGHPRLSINWGQQYSVEILQQSETKTDAWRLPFSYCMPNITGNR